MGIERTTATPINWLDLIREHEVWTTYNFGDWTVQGQMLGVIEELGELAHAHLKEEQGIRGHEMEHQLAAMDAIADMTVFLLGIMNRWKAAPHYPAEWRESETTATVALLSLTHEVGRAARVVVVGIDNPRLIHKIIHYAEAYCNARGWDYGKLVTDTWREVSKRDWRKFPQDGLTS